MKWFKLGIALIFCAVVVMVFVLFMKIRNIQQHDVDTTGIELLIQKNNELIETRHSEMLNALNRSNEIRDSIEKSKITYRYENTRISNMRGDTLTREYIESRRRVRARYLRDQYRFD